MSAHYKTLLPILAGASLLAFGGAAFAGECCKPKPPCCAPKPPPPPKPPCCAPKPPKPPKFPNVNVNVNVNASAQASAKAESNVFFGGGGSNIIATPGFPVIQALNVGVNESVRKAITETRSVFKQVVIQAVCIDDRGAPHPASQLFPDRDVRDSHKGELYRCVAGTKLQVTIADFLGKVSFDKGETLACAKGEALWHGEGKLECRAQSAQRNCFERSLLRRFGVGVKVLQVTRLETFTSYKEEIVETASSGSLALDGGVGGYVH